jgi:hypothetical protein
MIFLHRNSVYFFLCLILAFLCSCNKFYYRTQTTRQINADTLCKLIAEKKHFIVHSPRQVFQLTKPMVDSQDLEGERQTLTPEYYHYLHPKTDKLNVAPRMKNGMSFTNAQVHIYTDSILPFNQQISLPVKRIKRMDVYDTDRGSQFKNGVGINFNYQPVPGYRMVETVGFILSLRYIFHEREKNCWSLGAPATISFSILDDSSSVGSPVFHDSYSLDLRLGIMLDLPLIVNFNHSWKSKEKGLSSSGYFAGGGLGYHYNYYSTSNNSGTVIKATKGFGPVVNAGFRFALHDESRYNLEIRFSYQKIINSGGTDVFGVGCILNF